MYIILTNNYVNDVFMECWFYREDHGCTSCVLNQLDRDSIIFGVFFISVKMQAFIALVLVAVATAELQAPLYENSEPIKGKYIIKLKVLLIFKTYHLIAILF